MPPSFDSEGPDLTLDDLTQCGWEAALEERDRDTYGHTWTALQGAAEKANSEGHPTKSQALRLLMHISSMMLEPGNRHEPYQPAIIFSNGRSAIPDDFTAPELNLLEQFVDMVHDHWLEARINDLLWLRQSPRNPEFALAAIDTYRSIPLNGETWATGVLDCWKRAISLSKMLQQGAGDRLSQIQGDLFSLFGSATVKERFFALKLAEVMEEYDLGGSQETFIGERLQTLAEELQSDGDHNAARNYFANAAVWFRKSEAYSQSVRMTVAQAETWVKEAEASLASAAPSNILASTLYEKAIQTYRNIPYSHREQHQVDQRITEIRRRLGDAGLLSLDEMTVAKSEPIDLAPTIREAVKQVQNKTAPDAVLGLSNLVRVRVGELRKDAIESLHATPFRALISATLLTRDGRAAGRTPGFTGQSSPENDEAAIEAEMIGLYYRPLVEISVKGGILPALNVVSLEHRISEGDFIQLARLSPIIPPGREKLYGKALFHGYNKDFVSALHLLIPQIEHMVRYHLKMRQVTTSNLDREGIETENGLSTLVELPEVKQVFGEDIAFELKALFCSPFGPNLRNEVAHGLLEEDECSSPSSVYAWWLGLKLAFNTFWNSSQEEDQMEEQPSSKTGDSTES